MLSYLALLVTIAATLVRLVVGDIFDDIGGWLGSGISDVYNAVKNFVVGMLRHFVNFLTSVIDMTFSALSSVIDWVWQGAQALVGAVSAALSWWVGVLWDAIQAARDAAFWLVDQAIGAVRWWVATVFASFDWVVGQLWGLTNNLLGWVADNVFWPLVHDIGGVFGWVANTVIPWVAGGINNLWCFVKDVAGSIGGIAGGVFDELIGPFKLVLELGLKAIEWLAWMATHPFDWFVHLFDDFFSRGSSWLLSKMTDAVQSNMTQVDNWLSKFFE